jgi:hypothetical protein
MAMLKPDSGGSPWDLSEQGMAPAGTFRATCLAVEDRYNVERPVYGKEDQKETVNLTWLLFGYRDAKGAPRKISTRAMRISSNSKSALQGLLTPWFGGPFPCDVEINAPAQAGGVIGKKGLLTISHDKRQDGTPYAKIEGIIPEPAAQAAAPAPAPATPPPAPAATPAPMAGDEIPF